MNPSPTPPDTGAGKLPASVPVEVCRVTAGVAEKRPDHVAAEEPMEIRVEGESVAVVMRTPGEDHALTAGFLVTEGVVRSPADIFEISTCPGTVGDGGQAIDVLLTDPSSFDRAALSRNVFTGSSCGVCGKATIDSVMQNFPPLEAPAPPPDARMLASLPGKLRAAQETFETTGGLHACALFTRAGELRALHEDVGRHNALDKLIGTAALAGDLPLTDTVLFLSGRISFEMMQKALAARIPTVAAISAPTSLAVRFAEASGQYLAGFVRGDRYNIYAGPPE